LPSEGVVDEAIRQLNICNACRYCEGYCAVFPALERRSKLDAADVLQLANLCHDCQACLYACMYSPPHEFAVNPPAVLSQVRTECYEDLSRGPFADVPHRRYSVLGSFVVVLGLIVGLSAATVGLRSFGGGFHATSPYSVLSYPALLVLVLLPATSTVILIGWGCRRYWRDARGPRFADVSYAVLRSGLRDALTLKNLRGGGGECYYPSDVPSRWRREFHLLVSLGFGLCLVSTISAGILQDLASSSPFYRLVSVPVLTGLVGGIGLVVGAAGMLRLKVRASTEKKGVLTALGENGFLVGLLTLGITGIATLVTRRTTFFAYVLVLHLTTVVVAFALAPLTRFPHFCYRTLALIFDGAERERSDSVARGSLESLSVGK
jgi:citrate/tricarballylate utilization protein